MTRRRAFNQDGTSNLVLNRSKGLRFSDLYHSLLSVSWFSFFSLLILGYLLANLFFAVCYLLCGPGALEGVSNRDLGSRIFDCFFFSVQTLATIGYGRISPITLSANILVTIEALTGLLGLAMATGLLFARFSRPTARVVFSKVALVTPVDGVPSLVFRMANARMNQIVDARVDVTLLRRETTQEGEVYRNFYELKLERDRSPFFALSWTIVHPIDSDSPLYSLGEKEVKEMNPEIIVSLTGIDGTFSQNIHSRFSYITDDLVWGQQFVDILTADESKGSVHLKLENISDLRPVLPNKA